MSSIDIKRFVPRPITRFISSTQMFGSQLKLDDITKVIQEGKRNIRSYEEKTLLSPPYVLFDVKHDRFNRDETQAGTKKKTRATD